MSEKSLSLDREIIHHDLKSEREQEREREREKKGEAHTEEVRMKKCRIELKEK